ncbi:MAG TPA: hypothetical protein VG652_01430 [Gaiellaceae bacterium]|nr:hypothetical protein [Gaiellaceae bacterium]
MAATPLRPLSIGEILNAGTTIVWENLGKLVRVVVCVVLPVQIVATILTLSSLPDGWSMGGSPSGFPTDSFRISRSEDGVRLTGSQAVTFFAGFSVATLLTLVAGVLASAACFRIVATAYLGEPTGWQASLQFAARRFGSLLWLSFLSFLLICVGLVLCVIPGVYLAVGFAVAIPVLLGEEVRGSRALGRSRELVKGSWWRVLGVIIAGTFVTSIVTGAFLGVVYVITSLTSIGPETNSLVLGLEKICTGTITAAITTPIVAAFLVVLYFDLRIRREGVDVQPLADRLGVDAPVGLQAAPDPPQRGTAPFWPPPPGWNPSGGIPPAPPSADPAQPPFWPPPPGWKPPEAGS